MKLLQRVFALLLLITWTSSCGSVEPAINAGEDTAETNSTPSDPGIAAPDPGTAAPDPGTAAPDPGTAAPDPGTAAPDSTECTPNCAPNSCGPDGCGGECVCEGGLGCVDGTCQCVPNCTGCSGDDGCGGSCECEDDEVCSDDQCIPNPDCFGVPEEGCCVMSGPETALYCKPGGLSTESCGSSGVCGWKADKGWYDCGGSGEGPAEHPMDCDLVCEPQCDGKECGPNACGSTCGTCLSNETCEDGTCVCQPDCEGKSCGSDGCGGTCGTCASNQNCVDGACECKSNSCGGDCGGCDIGPCGDDGMCECASICATKECGDSYQTLAVPAAGPGNAIPDTNIGQTAYCDSVCGRCGPGANTLGRICQGTGANASCGCPSQTVMPSSYACDLYDKDCGNVCMWNCGGCSGIVMTCNAYNQCEVDLELGPAPAPPPF